MKPITLSGLELGAALLLCASVAGAQTPTITPTANASTLVNAILGPGVTLVPGSEQLTGGPAPDLSAGLFDNGGLTPAGIGIARGIVLTTGKAADATAPNDAPDKTTILGLPGDAQLTGLAGYETSDATVLSFSFTTTAQSDLSFRFAFASEEYLEYVGSEFNDVFAFYLDGQNLAVIPGTNDPISINTLNAQTNAVYFRDNAAAAIQVQYDGLTTVLTVRRFGLPPGTHTMKFAIADASDGLLDSAVFVEGTAFQANYTLTVSKTGTGGTGTVTSSNPTGITCGTTCSAAFASGTAVTLTATPAAGSEFAGWSGGGCSGTGTCTVTMSSAQAVTATFNLTPTLPPGGDADTDGLTNDFETKYGLNPSSGLGVDGPSGDPDGDGRTNLQEQQDGTHPRGFVITYLAEGATGVTFDTRLAVANPTASPALVLTRFQKGDGTTIRDYRVVPPMQRATIDVESLAGLEAAEFSTLVEADVQVVVDRTMTWDQSGYGSHAERGILTRTATKWYFAEGATFGSFNLFYLIQNPNTQAAQVRVTYLLPAGAPLRQGVRRAPAKPFQHLGGQRGPDRSGTGPAGRRRALRGHRVHQRRPDHRRAGDVPGSARTAVRRGARERGRHRPVDAVVPGRGRHGRLLRPVHPHRQPAGGAGDRAGRLPPDHRAGDHAHLHGARQ